MVANDPDFRQPGVLPDDNAVPEDESFVRRWSRRKARVQADARAPRGAVDARSPSGQEQSTDAKTDADMPPLDALGEGSDFSQFLSPGVSEDLRRAALRKLFGLARFNVRDGLDDYDDDYRSFESLRGISQRIAEKTRERWQEWGEPQANEAGGADRPQESGHRVREGYDGFDRAQGVDSTPEQSSELSEVDGGEEETSGGRPKGA